jgi:hypothetical protein
VADVGARIQGGDGDDVIIVKGLNSGASVSGGAGDDIILTGLTDRLGMVQGGGGNDTIHRWYWLDEKNWIENFLEPGDTSTAYERQMAAAQKVLAQADYMDARTAFVREYSQQWMKDMLDWEANKNIARANLPESMLTWDYMKAEALERQEFCAGLDKKREELFEASWSGGYSLQAHSAQISGIVGGQFMDEIYKLPG